MESLIFLLVLVIIIITNVARMQKKAEDGSGGHKDEAPGWKKTLQDLLAEMQGEQAPSRKEQAPPGRGHRRPAGWEDLLPEEDAYAMEHEPAAQQPETRHGKDRGASDLQKGKTLIESRSSRPKISRSELRRAVIWYEVLGPPVSLRDRDRESWL